MKYDFMTIFVCIIAYTAKFNCRSRFSGNFPQSLTFGFMENSETIIKLHLAWVSDCTKRVLRPVFWQSKWPQMPQKWIEPSCLGQESWQFSTPPGYLGVCGKLRNRSEIAPEWWSVEMWEYLFSWNLFFDKLAFSLNMAVFMHPNGPKCLRNE